MGVWGLIAAIGVAIAASPALAQDSVSPNPCLFEVVGSGRVAKIIDGRDFMLDSGREVRLAAIQAPPAPAPDETGPGARAGTAAQAALTALIAGRIVELRQREPLTDRYGRTVAHTWFNRGGEAHSAGGELVAQGFARVSAHVGDHSCAMELLSQERAARTGKLGLWAEPYYDIQAAERGAELLARRGRFTVVEGKVLSVRESGGTVYVNFGHRWSRALTVTILKRHERIFRQVGLQPQTLANREVRVRGWIEERNGPRIEATSPEQIEIVTSSGRTDETP
jgi:endonuclease YncB( thermonuclease family)